MLKSLVLAAVASVLAVYACAGQTPLGKPAPGIPVLELSRPAAVAIDSFHRANPVMESAMCLLGVRVTPDSIRILGVMPARIIEAGPRRVRASCPPWWPVIGMVHNHPQGSVNCAVSVQDLITSANAPWLIFAHTCTERDGSTYLIVRRQDTPHPVVEGPLPESQ